MDYRKLTAKLIWQLRLERQQHEMAIKYALKLYEEARQARHEARIASMSDSERYDIFVTRPMSARMIRRRNENVVS